MVSKLSSVKKIVLTVLEDGQEHSSEEIKQQIQMAGIEINSGSSTLRSAIYQLRGSGIEIFSRDRGVYQIKKQDKQKEIDFLENFITLKPEKRISPKCVYVHEDGNIVLNGKLNLEIKDRQIEIRISKDGKRLALLLNGENSHKFTKSGSSRSKELIKLLKGKRISLPATYEMEWDKMSEVWLGTLYMGADHKKTKTNKKA